MALTQISTKGIKDGTISSADLADQSVTLAKLPHGTSSNDGKFLRANNGADPTFEIVSSIGGGTGVDFDDNVKVRFGTGKDLEIFHDGSHSFIKDTGTGTLRIEASEVGILSADGSETMAQFVQNGAASLRFDNSTKLETDSSGSVITGRLAFNNTGSSIQLADNQKATFGNGQDLQIFHDGSQSIIRDVGTGSLILQGSQVIMESADGGEVLAKFIDDGAVELYFNNSKKFETNNEGVKISGFLEMEDNQRIQMGTGDDLQIFHDGTDSFIKDVGTGALTLSGNLVQLLSANLSENMLLANENGAVELYHNGSKKFETWSGGSQVHGSLHTDELFLQDNEKIKLGASDDLQIFSDGTNGQIRNHVGGGIFIRANRNIQLMTNASDGGADNAVTCVNNGGVELYFDNSKKFQTTSGGISVSGDISVEDNSFIRVRTTGDNTSTAIQLGHDGTLNVSTIKNTSGGSSSTPEQIEQGRLKAYVKINAISGTFVRQSFGVSSVTDSGAGNYTVNFSTAFANDEYIYCLGPTNTNHSRGGVVLQEGKSTTTCDLFGTSMGFNQRFDVEVHCGFYGD